MNHHLLLMKNEDKLVKIIIVNRTRQLLKSESVRKPFAGLRIMKYWKFHTRSGGLHYT